MYDAEKNATFPTQDVLLEGSTISTIAPEITAMPGTKVIDAAGKVVCPGFVDTHRHLFQSHIRTSVANQTLLEYCSHLLLGRVVFYTGRCLSSAVGHSCGSHLLWRDDGARPFPHPAPSEHIEQCIRATIESGIRSVYCFAPYGLPKASIL